MEFIILNEMAIFEQIRQTGERIPTAGAVQLEGKVHDLIEFYRTLLQTYKDSKNLQNQGATRDVTQANTLNPYFQNQ